MALFKQIFAEDASSPGRVARNGVLSLFAPGTRTLIAITTVTGDPLDNPVTVNEFGFGVPFDAPGYTQVAWEAVTPGQVFQGTFESYEGVLEQALAAKTEAAEGAAAELASRIAAGEFRGEDGQDGSNVVPTAEAVSTGIDTAFGAQGNTIVQRILAWFKAIFSPLDTFHSKNYETLTDLFAAADTAGNCVIKIAAGTHTTAPLRLTKTKITIIAHGATIRLANGVNTSLLTVGPDAVNIHIHGGTWDQNKANNTAGHNLYWEPYTGPFRVADRSSITGAEILNAAEDAWHIGRGRVEVKASRSQIRDAGRYGVYFGGTDCRFEAGGIGLCAVAGVWNTNIGNWTKGNGIYYCGIGVRLTEGSRGSFISHNMIDVNKGVGIHIEGTTVARSMDAIIDSNLFLTNGFEADPATSSDIYMQYASSVVLSGNVGSKKVGTWALPAFAIRFGLGVANIIDAGNRWEPAAYTNAPYSDPALIATTTHRINATNTSGGNTLLRSIIGAETNPRFELLADGTIRLGSGAGATDVNLYRSAVDMLKTDDTFSALGLRITATNGAGYLELPHQTAAPGATAGRSKWFTRINANGKTETCVVYPSGVKVMDTEL